MNRRAYGAVLTSVWVVSLLGIAYLFVEGSSYYTAPLPERPRHPDYWDLKPGGRVGHTLGIAGSALMVLMHAYTLRKRLGARWRLGSLRAWLDFHIYCGVFGPLLVVLHSSLKVHGLVAISFWSMIAVAVSGVIGRYLYRQFPRRRSGAQMTLAEVEEDERLAGHRLREEFGLDGEAMDELDRISLGALAHPLPPWLLLLRLPLEGLVLRHRLHACRSRAGRIPGRLLREFSRAARRRAVLHRRVLLWHRLQQLFHYWHVFHKPFAAVMYLFMVVHIGVAVASGYGWGPGH